MHPWSTQTMLFALNCKFAPSTHTNKSFWTPMRNFALKWLFLLSKVFLYPQSTLKYSFASFFFFWHKLKYICILKPFKQVFLLSNVPLHPQCTQIKSSYSQICLCTLICPKHERCLTQFEIREWRLSAEEKRQYYGEGWRIECCKSMSLVKVNAIRQGARVECETDSEYEWGQWLAKSSCLRESIWQSRDMRERSCEIKQLIVIL